MTKNECKCEKIKEAYRIVIELYAMYGDEYWPLYLRMKREHEECLQKEALKELVKDELSVIIKNDSEG